MKTKYWAIVVFVAVVLTYLTTNFLFRATYNGYLIEKDNKITEKNDKIAIQETTIKNLISTYEKGLDDVLQKCYESYALYEKQLEDCETGARILSDTLDRVRLVCGY